MKRTVILLLGASVWIGVPAPARAQNRVDQQMFIEIRQLQEQNRQLMLAVNTALEQLKTVNTKVDSEGDARRKGFADQQTLINTANANVSALGERMSENKVQVQKVTQELDAVKKGVDMLTVMVTQALAQMPASAAPADPNAPPGSAPPAGTPPAGGVPASSEDYFNRAFGDYVVGQWELAIQGFQEYLKRFPQGPQIVRAQRLVGDSYFMMGKYPDAVAAYDLVVKAGKALDPSGDVPDAIYKQGVAYEQLKQREKAIDNYVLLRKDYPTSTAALQATQDLKRLDPTKIK